MVFRICGIMQHIDNKKNQMYCMQNPKDYYSLGLDTIGIDSLAVKNSPTINSEEVGLYKCNISNQMYNLQPALVLKLKMICDSEPSET